MLGRKYSGWSIVIALVFGSASVNRAQSNLLEVTSLPIIESRCASTWIPRKGKRQDRKASLFILSHSMKSQPLKTQLLAWSWPISRPLAPLFISPAPHRIPAWTITGCSQAKPPRSTTLTTASQFTRWRARARDASSISAYAAMSDFHGAVAACYREGDMKNGELRMHR